MNDFYEFFSMNSNFYENKFYVMSFYEMNRHRTIIIELFSIGIGGIFCKILKLGLDAWYWT